MIKMILAMDLIGGIGKEGSLPWHFKEDLDFFKSKIKNDFKIMAKNTWNDPKFPRKSLKDCFVVAKYDSHIKDLEYCDEYFVSDYNIVPAYVQLINDKAKFIDKDVWIIGGASLYNQFMGIAEEIYVTVVNDVYNCDTFIDGEKLNEFYKLTDYHSSKCGNLRFMKYKIVK